jgi:hypothetical protein
MSKEYLDASTTDTDINIVKYRKETSSRGKVLNQKFRNIVLATIMFLACPGDDIVAVMSIALPPVQQINAPANRDNFSENVLGIYNLDSDEKKKKERESQKLYESIEWQEKELS